MRAANVFSTIWAIELASTGKVKSFTFVSSTSALDTEHYVNLSDAAVVRSAESGNQSSTSVLGVPETDDIMGASKGLGTGYGQSKWVAEKLTMIAASRGLRASIVRPGYVVGDSISAVTNTDDFIWRLVKGCIQLGLVPDMHNVINMVPVDHVARITALASIDLTTNQELKLEKNTFAKVYHVTAHPIIRFNDLLGKLRKFGWETKRIDYVKWRASLENHVMMSGKGEADNALFPLVSNISSSRNGIPSLDTQRKISYNIKTRMEA